jgi:hypothetical protein
MSLPLSYMPRSAKMCNFLALFIYPHIYILARFLEYYTVITKQRLSQVAYFT